MRYVNLVGVELEGAWESDPADNHNTAWHRDGSVSFSERERRDFGGDGHIGEVVIDSPVSLPKALDWIRGNYPDLVNPTCGLHVHLSFKQEAHYVALASKPFWEAFKLWSRAWGEREGLSARHQYWDRLAGSNQYCKDTFDPESQFSCGSGGARYRHLNFAWKKHGTLECRLFPCFPEVETAQSAVKSYVEFVEQWLIDNFPRFKMRAVGQVIDDAPLDELQVLRKEEVCVC